MIPQLMLDGVADPATRASLKQVDSAVTTLQRLSSNVALKSRIPLVAGGGTRSFFTDNSGGTAGATIAAISDVPTRNAIASLTAAVNKLIAVVIELSKAEP